MVEKGRGRLGRERLKRAGEGAIKENSNLGDPTFYFFAPAELTEILGGKSQLWVSISPTQST